MKYHFVRLFLLETERPPILEQAKALPDVLTREQFLTKIFSERIDFQHRNRHLVFIPVGSVSREPGYILLGRIGTTKIEIENQPPEAGFKETEHESWRAANILIDTRDFSDGQKVAFQYRADVGKPLAIVGSLISHINEVNVDSGWFVEPNLITEKSSFWEVVEKRKGDITSAVFSFVTPNVLRLPLPLMKILRRIESNTMLVG